MPRLLAALAALALCASPALADDVDDIRVALPEAVELAELQPGLHVITRLDLEVFWLDGAYWLQDGARWYGSRRPLEGFQAVEPRGVPPALARLERGRYLDYRPAQGQRVAQRRIGAEPAPGPGGVQVDAGPARVVPRGGAPAAPPAPPPAPAAEEPRPPPAAPKAPARTAPLAPAPAKAAPPARKPPAKPAAKPAPPKKPPPKKPAAAK
jgi:hypothetical protein